MKQDALDRGDAQTGALIVGSYRYRLWRTWDPKRRAAMFVMLNPSTVAATENDPAIRRCIEFAKRWGYGGLEVGNLFAYRTPNPDELLDVAAIGPNNDGHLIAMCHAGPGVVVAAWGVNAPLDRSEAVLDLLVRSWDGPIYCLGKTKDGVPRHPLYVPATMKLLKVR